MNKKYLILLSFISISSIAQSSNNSNILVNADITGGCHISFPSINFGIVSKDSAWDDGRNRIIQKMNISCSNGISFVLSGDVAKKGTANSVTNLTGNSYAHPLYSLDQNVSDYLGFLVVAPKCGDDNNPLTHKFSGGSNPIVGTSQGELIQKDICFSLKGMKGFPGYGVRPGTYSGYYTFTITY